MAVLEKIRVKFGVAASIIIALGLLSFIIDPSELSSAFQSMSSKNDVGKIGGKSISYTDFQEDVQRMTTVNELISGTSASSSEQQDQIRNATWQNLVYRYLFNKNARNAGIHVGEEEIVDLTTGANLSPLVFQNPIFLDENGNFSKEQLVNFIQTIPSDQTGQLRLYWNYLQESIMNQQYAEKYNSLFTAASGMNALQLRNAIAENNNTTDVNFVMVPYSYATDSTIVITDAEIKEYFNSRKQLFRQQASRDMEYVVYEVVPSAKDIENTSNEINALVPEFEATTNVRSFLVKNSDRSFDDRWYKPGELSTVSSDVDSFVWGDSKAPVSDVFRTGNNFFVAKVVDSKNIPDSVYVKHLLFQGDDAKHLADSLLPVVAKGENIANLAALYSADKGSAADGELGSIGWMTQNYMIPGLESVMTAEIGKPYILNSQYGTHIVLVTKRTTPIAKKQVAILQKEALASKETFNEWYNKANKFATAAAGSYDNYRKAVDTLGVYSHPLNNMLESNSVLGSIDNAKEVTRWVYDNKVGKVSPIITIDNNYFIIATVKGIHKEGIADLSDVAPTIRQELYFEKMSEKKKAEVADQIAGMTDLEAIAEKLGASVSTQSGVAFSSLTSQSVDPKFVGALSVSPEGKICGPVAGGLGVFVYQVTGRDTGAFFTEDDAKARFDQQNMYLGNYVIPVMMQDADVKDNRARFF